MKLICLILVLLYFPSIVLPQSSSGTVRDQSRLKVHINHLVGLSNLIRKYATSKSEPRKMVEGLEEAVSTTRELNEKFGGWVGGPWAIIEVSLSKCQTASEALQVFPQLPETYTLRSGKQIQLREGAIQYGKALKAIEHMYLKDVWPQHYEIVKGAIAEITKVFAPKEKECFDYLTTHLGMEKTQSQVPVYLVAESPWPGGFTIRSNNEDGTTRTVVVISVEAHQGSNLFESLLHEVIHALDLETKGNRNVLIEVRDLLLKAGLTERDQAVQHGAHWLVFIQAGETVRRFLDPAHEHYGKDLYKRLGRISKVDVVRKWIGYLDGKIPREEAVNKIVDGFLEAHKGTLSTRFVGLQQDLSMALSGRSMALSER